MLLKAQRILSILELTNFAWDINTILSQPEEEMAAVFALKFVGNKIQRQALSRARSKPPVTGTP